MINAVYIDDEADTQAMASRFEDLAEVGINIIPIVSVVDCLDILKPVAPTAHVIVLDQIMPPMGRYSLNETAGGTTTGLSLLREIRKLYPSLPVVILSVSDAPPESLCQELGILAFLKKPVALDTLAATIRKAARK